MNFTNDMEVLDMDDVINVLIVMGVPVAVTGFFFWLVQRKITQDAHKREQKALERENNSERLMLTMIETTRASIVLGKATARAVQRIPDAHCNGDMDSALAYVDEQQKKQKEFLTELGVHSLYE